MEVGQGILSQLHLQKQFLSPEDDTVVVDSNSDEEIDIDNDTVMVSMPLQAMRTPPSDAGFSDFDDFGGFQANDSPPSNSREELQFVTDAAKQDTQWNAFSDPTDAGGTNCQERHLLRRELMLPLVNILIVQS